jgi:hypothetical protein
VRSPACLSVGKAMRALSPEWVAEDLYSAQVQAQARAES